MPRTNRQFSEWEEQKLYPYQCFLGILSQRMPFVNGFFENFVHKNRKSLCTKRYVCGKMM